MDTKRAGVRTIGGEAEVDHAIATLVLAFSTDPVARWMYDDPHQYLRYIPRLFKALGTAAFESGAAHRTGDGLGVALWLPPDVHADDGPLEAVIGETIAAGKQADVGAMLERTEDYRPKEPHWASKCCTGAWDVARRCCTMAFANAIGSTFRPTSGPPID